MWSSRAGRSALPLLLAGCVFGTGCATHIPVRSAEDLAEVVARSESEYVELELKSGERSFGVDVQHDAEVIRWREVRGDARTARTEDLRSVRIDRLGRGAGQGAIVGLAAGGLGGVLLGGGSEAGGAFTYYTAVAGLLAGAVLGTASGASIVYHWEPGEVTLPDSLARSRDSRETLEPPN